MSNNGSPKVLEELAKVHTEVLDLMKGYASNTEEVTHLQQLLWAVLQETGGRASVPFNTWMEGSSDRQVIMWEDGSEGRIFLRAITREHSDTPGS